jgi:cytochrome c-type biogenesis protein CcmH/NrfF
MRRLAAGLAVLALAAAAPAMASNQHPTQAEMESDLVCPACHEPLDESTSPIAQQMKVFIRRKIAAGWTKSQIENALVAQLGPTVLGVPGDHGFDLLAWLLPFTGIGLGAVGIGAAAWYWSRNRSSGGGAGPPGLDVLDPVLERRIDDELARFDG